MATRYCPDCDCPTATCCCHDCLDCGHYPCRCNDNCLGCGFPETVCIYHDLTVCERCGSNPCDCDTAPAGEPRLLMTPDQRKQLDAYYAEMYAEQVSDTDIPF